MDPISLKLRLTLSSAGSLLCTVQNQGDADETLKHSPTVHHTELMIFDEKGVAMPFIDRMKNRTVDAKDKRGHGIKVAAGERAHLSHSRIVYDEKGAWGINWGIKRYFGLKPGIYRFVASHPQTQSTNLVTFEIPKMPKS